MTERITPRQFHAADGVPADPSNVQTVEVTIDVPPLAAQRGLPGLHERPRLSG